LVLLSLALPAAAAAQERRGLWFGLGGGAGAAGVSCNICDGGRETGEIGYVRGGWTLNERTLIGGDVAYWSKKQALDAGVQGTIELTNVLATVAFYPKATSGFFLKGGAGATFVTMTIDTDGSNVAADLGKGLGLIAGAGYDIPLSRRVSLTPAVNFWYGQPGRLRFAGETVATSWKQNIIDFTFGFTFQ